MSDETLRTIRLYGRLGAKFGRVHRLAVASAAEAVRALCALHPAFEPYLCGSKDRGEGYAVFYGKENLDKDDLQNPSGDDDIRIAPIILGAKNSGVFSIVLGAVLVFAGVALSWVPFVGAALVNMGVALIVGGIVQLLTPIPKGSSAEDRPENKPSAMFNGPVNTQAQGNPVAVLIGELIVGSAVISAGITAQDQAFVPSGRPVMGSGGGGGGGSSPWHAEWVV